MKSRYLILVIICVALLGAGCGKDEPEYTPPPAEFNLSSSSLNGNSTSATSRGVNLVPQIALRFSAKIDRSTVASGLSLTSGAGTTTSLAVTYTDGDNTLILQPSAPLLGSTRYTFTVTYALKSTDGAALRNGTSFQFITAIDSTDKFTPISDSALVQAVQRETFKYFWNFGHPVSGMARERNTSGNTVTTGGTGFGVMAIITGIHRGFITRAEGLQRLQTLASFLRNTAQRFHGAFPHWMNGGTGEVVPFSARDNGADLVETSFLIQGLLAARQYFNGGDAMETALRTDIDTVWRRVEWNWFRKGSENVLYWHWSPTGGWDINLKIQGWNECLITYALAASSPTYPIPKVVYDQGFARGGAMVNGSSYYGYPLPLGNNLGGPLFFSHYSFLGINPNGLVDAYANYGTQNVAHSKINYEYCKANPKGWYGYSDQCWGLTASDIPNGYSASSPTNDLGVIAPTAALSSFPYTPAESMKALRFFYYKLGDRLWGEYGFRDAFNLSEGWFASSYLAIDQGPIVVMIENYRSGLLWNLFMSCPEVKTGMRGLGFTSPNL